MLIKSFIRSCAGVARADLEAAVVVGARMPEPNRILSDGVAAVLSSFNPAFGIF